MLTASLAWKNYALARLDKISPKVYHLCTIRGAARSGVGSRKGPSSSGLKQYVALIQVSNRTLTPYPQHSTVAAGRQLQQLHRK